MGAAAVPAVWAGQTPGAPPATDTAPAAATTATAVGAGTRAVTLISGDTVDVAADGRRFTVSPGPGHRAIGFLNWQAGGHLHVVPSDATPLIQSGRLDPRLFDLTTLLDAGYDDSHGPLPLIVAGSSPVPVPPRSPPPCADRTWQPSAVQR